VLVNLGKIEAILRRRNRCPAKTTSTASGSSATSCRCRRASVPRRSWSAVPIPTWYASCLRSRFPSSSTARSRSPRSPVRRPPDQDRGALDRAGRQRKGCLHRPDGLTGTQRDVRAERREDRHRGLFRGPGAFCGERVVPPVLWASRSSTRCPRGAGGGARLPALTGDRQGRPERAGWPPG